jgi:hypothetical protein
VKSRFASWETASIASLMKRRPSLRVGKCGETTRWQARPREWWAGRWILSCVLHSKIAEPFCTRAYSIDLRSASMEADQLGRLRDILQASRLIASYMKDIESHKRFG